MLNNFDNLTHDLLFFTLDRDTLSRNNYEIEGNVIQLCGKVFADPGG